MVLVYDIDPAEVLRLIETYGVTNSLFVPAVLQILSAFPGVEKTDLSSFRRIVYGASPISEEVLVRSMRVFACEFAQVYGLTETTGAITCLAPEDHEPDGPRAGLLRSAGRPWGDVAVRIVDAETGKNLPDGEVGEIWCASAQNMKGYWSNPEATEEVYPEGRDADGIGFFRTGDAGYMHEGFLYIHDRVKDMIVSGGENVYPAEIENVLMSHPDIADLMNRVRQPFNVNSMSLAAALVALDDDAHLKESVRVNKEGMKMLTEACAQLGLGYIPSVGNFLTIDFGRDAMPVYDGLLREGVIVRPIGVYGLPNHLRVTIGLPEENMRFVGSLQKVLNADLKHHG